MKPPDRNPIVFLLDVDNTLLDNDRIEQDLRDHLKQVFGLHACTRYWTILEELRQELGYADFLGALQRYRLEHLHDPRLLGMSSFLVDYPFAKRLYPKALEVVAHLHAFGPVAILSDGDAVFQPRKVVRSGLWRAVEGRVLIYIHKEEMLDEVESKYPAEQYVFVDDKPRLLAAVKQVWGKKVMTVFARQGHYAQDPVALKTYLPSDVSIQRISDLLEFKEFRL
jgi:FMN phosphatase YigB (HAD superfamily)